MKNKKLIYKILSYTVILAVFFFFGKHLVNNWQKVKEYQFSFNYLYLFLSSIFFSLTLITYALIWNMVLRVLDKEKRISNFKAIKIFVSSWFGRYIPGKLWMFLGRIYLGSKEGLSKKALAVSSLFEIVLSVSAAFIWALLLLSITFGSQLYYLYFIPLVIIIGTMIFAHPKIFYPICNFGLRKVKKEEIPKENYLSYVMVIKVMVYHFIAFAFDGFGFFLLINSIIYLPFCDIIGIMGGFTLAAVLGAAAIFAPGGLGIREGILATILTLYFPLSIAVLITLVSRIWMSMAEILLFSAIHLYSKLRNI